MLHGEAGRRIDARIIRAGGGEVDDVIVSGAPANRLKGNAIRKDLLAIVGDAIGHDATRIAEAIVGIGKIGPGTVGGGEDELDGGIGDVVDEDHLFRGIRGGSGGPAGIRISLRVAHGEEEVGAVDCDVADEGVTVPDHVAAGLHARERGVGVADYAFPDVVNIVVKHFDGITARRRRSAVILGAVPDRLLCTSRIGDFAPEGFNQVMIAVVHGRAGGVGRGQGEVERDAGGLKPGREGEAKEDAEECPAKGSRDVTGRERMRSVEHEGGGFLGVAKRVEASAGISLPERGTPCRAESSAHRCTG